MVLKEDLRLFHLTLKVLSFKQTVQILFRCRVLRCLIWVCNVCQCPSPGFTDSPPYTALWRRSDKNSAALNYRYLDFVQARGLISLVNDNHVDSNRCMYTHKMVKFLPFTLIVILGLAVRQPVFRHMRTAVWPGFRCPQTETLDTTECMKGLNDTLTCAGWSESAHLAHDRFR